MCEDKKWTKISWNYTFSSTLLVKTVSPSENDIPSQQPTQHTKMKTILNELKIWSQNDHRLWKSFLDSNCRSTKPRARVPKVRKQATISTCPPCVIRDNCLILSLILFGYMYTIIESFLTLKAQLVNQDNPNVPNRDISKPAGLIATASFG